MKAGQVLVYLVIYHPCFEDKLLTLYAFYAPLCFHTTYLYPLPIYLLPTHPPKFFYPCSLLLDWRSIDLSGAQEKQGHFHYNNSLRASEWGITCHTCSIIPKTLYWGLGLSLTHSKGILGWWSSICDTSFWSSQKVFIMKVTFFFSCTIGVDWPPI